ncbi:MAG: YigZ family protein [Clostridiales bacterium]|nr:YigZ family protein [Clostridiales bacterium]
MSFSAAKEGEYVYEISRSKFLGFCARVKSDEEAAAFISALRKKYRDARHVCYAYVLTDSARSNDDGEPSGTAGVPILERIKAANLCETLVAVVRYFGGIKLGAGGLLRAYAHTAAQTLASAGKTEVELCRVYTLSVPYALFKKIEKRPLVSLYKMLSVQYNRAVECTVAATDEDALQQELKSLFGADYVLTFLGEERVERER